MSEKLVETEPESAFVFEGKRDNPLPILDEDGNQLTDEQLEELGLK
mgnify:CR=1 FL=1|jgi:hypothetical protein